MVQLGIIENFVVALLLGLIVGLEREFQHQQQRITDFAGIRTFILIALFGWLTGFLSQELYLRTLPLFGLGGMIVFTITAYLAVVWRVKRITTTTAFSAIIVFILGVCVSYQYILIAVISAILMTTVLSYKYTLHAFAKKLELEEVHAGLKLGIISVVMLPLLPNKAYAPTDIPFLQDILALFPDMYRILQETQIFNPFKLWLIVVFICALSSVGYVLIKTVGTRKGIGIIGAIGGIVSSTAVTSALAESSKRSKWQFTFAFGVIIAWTVMFFRVLFVILILNKALFSSALQTIGLMLLAALGCALYFYFQRTPQGKKQKTDVGFTSPFALAPALKIGAFFVAVLFIAKILQAVFGSTGIYFVSILTGFADVDPIIISLTTLAAAGEINATLAVTGITLAVASNTIAKASIAYLFGGKEFAKKIIVCTGIILTVGLLTLLFL